MISFICIEFLDNLGLTLRIIFIYQEKAAFFLRLHLFFHLDLPNFFCFVFRVSYLFVKKQRRFRLFCLQELWDEIWVVFFSKSIKLVLKFLKNGFILGIQLFFFKLNNFCTVKFSFSDLSFNFLLHLLEFILNPRYLTHKAIDNIFGIRNRYFFSFDFNLWRPFKISQRLFFAFLFILFIFFLLFLFFHFLIFTFSLCFFIRRFLFPLFLFYQIIIIKKTTRLEVNIQPISPFP